MDRTAAISKPVKKSANQYFPALTGLRAVAVLMVFLHHSRHNFTEKKLWLFKLLEEFDFGVTIFFVLSGFLIAHQYRRALELKQVNFRHYLVQRIGRILPVYWLLTFVYFLYTLPTDWQVWVLNISLTRALFKDYLFEGIGPAWSLTVEVCFYFAAPVIFIWFKRKYSIWLLTFLTVVFGLLLVLLSNGLHLGSFFADTIFMFDYTFFGRCFAFYAGVKLAEYFEQAYSSEDFPTWLKFSHKACIGFGWMLVSIFLNLWLKDQTHILNGWTTSLIFLNEFFLSIPGICLILAGLALERNWVQRFLASKPIKFMGKASYIVYLLHAGLFFEILYFHVTKNTFIIYLIVNMLSMVGFVLYEEPARKFLVRKFAGRDRQNC